MTDIPGTGKLSLPEDNLKKIPEIPLSFVNVKELKKKKGIEPSIQVGPLWYENIYYWLGLGVFIGLIFFLLSFRYKRFFILTPLGPVATIATYYVRKFVRKFDEKPKKYS